MAAARGRALSRELGGGLGFLGQADRRDEGVAHRGRRRANEAARWALDAEAAIAESPIGRYAVALALLILDKDERPLATPSTYSERVSARRRGRARSSCARPDGYATAVAQVRRSFEEREEFLEDVPVPDTALALDALAAQRRLD